MNLSEQVCSLELAKRLKELGVKQNSLFYYQNQPYNDGTDDIVIMIDEIVNKWNSNCIINTEGETDDYPKYSAFTVAEISEMLPDCIDGNKLFKNNNSILLDMDGNFIKSQKKDDEYKIYIDGLTNMVIFFSKNEADARAKMLIYLIENNLLDAQ